MTQVIVPPIKGASLVRYDLSAADAVWIATAMLHKESGVGIDQSFETEQIVSKVEAERLTSAQHRTIYQHVNQHCVANRDPLPNKPRMLFATGQGRRRLWIEGDRYSPLREDAPSRPDKVNLPSDLRHWLDWYDDWSRQQRPQSKALDPLLALIGSGKHLWADEHADEYVRNLREGWE